MTYGTIQPSPIPLHLPLRIPRLIAFALGIALLAGLGLILATTNQPSTHSFAATVPASTTDLEQELVELSNSARTDATLSALSWNEELYAAASAKAAHMLASDYFDHVAPDGTTPWSFIRAAGYEYLLAGENLATDFTDQRRAIPAWLASPSHRANLLDPDFTDIAVAVASGEMNGKKTTVVVQMFGDPE